MPPTNTQTEVKSNSSPSIFSGKKIMWVEDDKFLSDLIAKKLSGSGAALVHAADGETALSMIGSELPDVLLLDIILPGMNGFDLLDKIKADQKTRNIPVVLLSNLGQKADIDRGMGLGAEKFLVEATVTLDEIVEEIRLIVEKKR